MTRGMIRRVWGEGGLRLALGDGLIVGALLAAALGTLVRPTALAGTGGTAVVTVAGGAARRLDLSRDAICDVAGPLGVTSIGVRGGKVRILSSPCPRGLCRHAGSFPSSGGPIVCVPNGVAVSFPASGPEGVDARTR